ncbi:MAG: cytochrome c oxidase subunit 3 [Phycisphaerae bacterium]
MTDPNLQPLDDPHPGRLDAHDKKLHIAGAGTAGMAILVVSLSILFAASMVAYIIVRMQIEIRLREAGYATTWPPPGMPHIPSTLWLSTLVILISSITIQMALNAVRRDNLKALRRNLIATFSLGLLFLLLQTLNWCEFYFAIHPGTQIAGAYLGMFYTLTGLHAAHVIGGLIPLAIVTARSFKDRYSRNYHPGIRYSTVYWHFLDAIWLILFCVIYF